jgi:nitroreductase
MKVSEAIKTRRATKQFDPNFKIDPAAKQELFKLLQETPTSFNIQNWRIVAVENTAARAQIRKAAWDQSQMTDAAMLLVICADLKAWERSPERYWERADPAVRERLVPMIKGFYQGREQLQRDEALRSVGLVAQTLMLAAREFGWDSCPMVGYDPETVARIINLPADHLLGMIVTVGKAAVAPFPKGGYLPLEEMVKIDKF